MQANIVLFQLELPLHTVVQSLKQAKAIGKIIILNPAPASPLPDDCYGALDHLIVNESEASILSGVPEAQLSQSLDEMADRFLRKGVQCVVVTLGSKGVFWKLATEDQGHSLKAHRVKAVDTTAAGDTFVGAYAAYSTERNASALQSTDVQAAVEFANRAASLSVQRPGAQASIPRRHEVEAL